jgi:dephospho-CoA kinase
MAERMQRWVVTGPIGSGKSLLTGLLRDRGAAVICADEIGHELLRRDEVIAAITVAFGRSVLIAGEVDRSALGRLVFADDKALAQLDAITHPRLAAEIEIRLAAEARAGQTDLAVLEAAVYFLLPSLPMDLTIAVVADAQLRRERLVRSGRLTDEEARQRIAAQQSLEAHWPRADVTLVNEGTEEELARAARRALRTRWPGLDTEDDHSPGGD